MVVTLYTRNMKKNCSRNVERGAVAPLEVQIWNVEPAHCWTPGGQRAPKGFFWVGGERAEGKGQGGGLGVEFTTTPAWVLEP